MDYTIFLPVIIAFALSAVMGPLIIPVLRRLKMDQTEREDGVKSHLKKAGTPTMGGVMILLSVVITSVFYIKDYPNLVSDTWIRSDWIFRRLSESCYETF